MTPDFAVISLTPEAWNAIIMGVLGSFGTFVISRYAARRMADREDVEAGRQFRGELRDDNASLRGELKDIKEERDRLMVRLEAAMEELNKLQAARAARHLLDAASDARAKILLNDNLDSKNKNVDDSARGKS